MKSTDTPRLISIPFARDGEKRDIPNISQIGITNGAASYPDGFVPLNFIPKESGGVPPFGVDFNGLFNQITSIQQWQNGGGLFKFSDAFSTAIGGYPKGATIISDDGLTVFVSKVDDNATNPNVSPIPWSKLDINLRSDLQLPSGSSNVIFTAASGGAVPRSVQSKLRDFVSILDDGGSNNGTTSNTPAIISLSADGYRKIKFPAGGVNNYLFDSTLLPSITEAMEWDVDPGVTITIPDTANLSPSLRVTRDTRVVLSALNDEYVLTPSRGYASAYRPPILTQSDADFSKALPIFPNAGELNFKQIDWPAGDTFSAFTPAATSSTGVQVSPPVDFKFNMAMMNLKVGEEAQMQFTGLAGGSVRIIGMVRTASGYTGIYSETGDNVAPSYFEKYIGNAAFVADNINYPAVNTHISYAPYFSVWTIKRISVNSYSILFNGTEVISNQPVIGEILECGFGVYANSGTPTIVMQDWVKVIKKRQGGKRPLRIYCGGDSGTSQYMFDTWPNWLPALLDGFNGQRVHEIGNFAVSGAGIEPQSALITSASIANYDRVAFACGINNIQAGTPVATVLTALDHVIDTCESNGKPLHVVVPDMYYGWSVAGTGVGQNTNNYGNGKDIRAKIVRRCAERNVKVVDTLQVFGTITAQYVNPTIANSYYSLHRNPGVYDNIHKTAGWQQLWAMAIARSIAGGILGDEDISQLPTSLDSSTLRNGTTYSTQPVKWYRDDSGKQCHSGVWDIGATKADGTVFCLFPESLRPLIPTRITCGVDGGKSCLVNIDPNGECSMYGFPATGSTWISADSIQFPSRLM